MSLITNASKSPTPPHAPLINICFCPSQVFLIKNAKLSCQLGLIRPHRGIKLLGIKGGRISTTASVSTSPFTATNVSF